MSEERRKINKHSTGTVPKVKYRNNTSRTLSSEEDPNRTPANNLSTERQLSDFIRNCRRNNCIAMDMAAEDLPQPLNYNGNGCLTPGSSSSASRRNSSGLKCDNVTKYPDAKQIEEKLDQIREYLHITTALMANIKVDEGVEQAEREGLEKMVKDLKDSERKLLDILEHMDGNSFVRQSVEEDHSLDSREEPTNSDIMKEQQLLKLKQKAENKLRDARQIQDKLFAQFNESKNVKKEVNPSDFDAAIKELEERAKRLNRREPNYQETLLAQMDTLHNEIVGLHNANEERGQLIEVLDNRDAELRSQHVELQSKLKELQSKKQHVDQLVAQLQNLNEEDEEEDEMGGQVRKIVSMKGQLKKLKDMLEVVKTTETVIQNTNDPQEANSLALDVCVKAENFLQNDFEGTKVRGNNMFEDRRRSKQTNKNDRILKSGAAQKMALQLELESKKRELEEIMGKHKASSSNLNHDIGGDMKSEYSCHSVNEAWNSERFSSEDESPEINGYDGAAHNMLSVPNSTSRVRENPRIEYPTVERLRVRTPDRSQDQIKKQLQLIKNVCDSMLEQQSHVQVRNNLSPSPIYSEPRRASPHPTDGFAGVNNANSINGGEMAGYQNWLATNNLQTQSFMLNTLNQCCQMLWLQQRELQNLRSTVTMLQERLDGHNMEIPVDRCNPVERCSNPVDRCSNQCRSNAKVNVAAACSMPNLNQYNVPHSNIEMSYANSSGRFLDPCMNNLSGEQHQHTNMHGVNANVNQAISSQLWNAGPALNNQVPPGNRANNYWDNFRSYSRQNLLSNKNNEGFQNLASLDRNSQDRAPFPLIAFSKSNSEHESTSTSQENTPRRAQARSRRENSNPIPPDVLNINHSIKANHGSDDGQSRLNEDDLASFFHSLIERRSSEDCKDFGSSGDRRRNEWRNEAAAEAVPKSKLFDELRENVYKEVASLISANEARPHFLIQLFRDLQMIGSDSLRLKALQSIQTVINQSIAQPRPLVEVRENHQESEGFSLQSTVWSKSPKNTAHRNIISLEGSDTDLQNTFKDIIPFLNDHEDEFIQMPFLITLKQMMLESESFKEIFKDSVFKKHFSNILDEVLEQYIGKRVSDIKMHFLQSGGELLRGELSFIHLIKETNPLNLEGAAGGMFDISFESKDQTGIENGDLAEADQTLEDEHEEEGAVGGFLDISSDHDYHNIGAEGEEILDIDYSRSSEGLDQVPTRLATKSKSRSTTPVKADSTVSENDF